MKWFCGFHDANEQENDKALAWENKLSSLEQDPRVKKVLYILMIVVIAFGIVMYIFWSLWKYPYPNGGSSLTEHCNETLGYTVTDL